MIDFKARLKKRTTRRRRRSGRLSRRLMYVGDLGLFLLALLVLATVVNYFAYRPEARMRVDTTKTRAYSLSPQSEQLLDSLEGEWTIAVVASDQGDDTATRRQIDEVLRRYEAWSTISVLRVDPLDPRMIGAYEDLIGRLRELESDRIAAYERALDAGVAAFSDLQLFAQQQAAQLEDIASLLPEDDPTRAEVLQRVGLIGLLADEGGKVLDAIDEARSDDEEQPIPDYETARSILASALSQWADELYGMRRIYDQWATTGDIGPELAAFGRTVREEYGRMAEHLALTAEPLVQLPPLETAIVGRQLRRGEAGVILGPEGARVIPAEQLFPRLNVREIGDGAVAFDRRFRGEQVISAGIRSLLVDSMPMVVFMHGEARSLLRSNQQSADVTGAAAMLGASRFEVREWSVGRSERPVARDGQKIVWIVVPPTQRQGLEISAEERALLRATAELLADGEPVMLNVYPSLRPRYNQTDPWAQLAGVCNIEVDTSRTIAEALRTGPEEYVYEPGQAVDEFSPDHTIGRAVSGLPAYFVLPLPVRRLDPSATGVDLTPLAVIEPSAERWLDAEWAGRGVGQPVSTPGTPFDTPIPVVMTARRLRPDGGGTQRVIVTGSGGWMLTYVTDALTPLGSGRALLTNPGNHELLLASVAWLSGMEELIAPSAVSRQAARLDGVDRGVQIRWGLFTTLFAPIGCLAIGAFVMFRRRS